MDSINKFKAFRTLVYHFSKQLTKHNCDALVYIYIYSHRERYRSATALEVLSRLEADGVFAATNPEGLIDVAKSVKRKDLVKEVSEYIRRQQKRAQKGRPGTDLGSAAADIFASSDEADGAVGESFSGEPCSLHLKNALEVSLLQLTVLIQHVQKLQAAAAELTGTASKSCCSNDSSLAVSEAIEDACQTAEQLAYTFRKAQRFPVVKFTKQPAPHTQTGTLLFVSFSVLVCWY